MLTLEEYEKLGGLNIFYPVYKNDIKRDAIDAIPLFNSPIFRVNNLQLLYKGTDVLFPIGKYENVYWNGKDDKYYREKLLKVGDRPKLEDYIIKKYGDNVISRMYVDEVEFYPSVKKRGEVPERFENRKKLPEEKYIVRLARDTVLSYFPLKDVIDAIVLSDFEPSEINGFNGSLNDIIAYLRYNHIEPTKEGRENLIIQLTYDLPMDRIDGIIKRHWR